MLTCAIPIPNCMHCMKGTTFPIRGGWKRNNAWVSWTEIEIGGQKKRLATQLACLQWSRQRARPKIIRLLDGRAKWFQGGGGAGAALSVGGAGPVLAARQFRQGMEELQLRAMQKPIPYHDVSQPKLFIIICISIDDLASMP